MKTPKQWVDIIHSQVKPSEWTKMEGFISAIQADALYESAAICERTPTCGGSGRLLAYRLRQKAAEVGWGTLPTP